MRGKAVFHLLDQCHARHTKKPPHLRGAGEVCCLHENNREVINDILITGRDVNKKHHLTNIIYH